MLNPPDERSRRWLYFAKLPASIQDELVRNQDISKLPTTLKLIDQARQLEDLAKHPLSSSNHA